MKIHKSFMILLALGTLTACTKVVTKEKSSSNDHYMTAKSSASVHEVVDGDLKMRFMNKDAFTQLVKDGSIKASREDSSGLDSKSDPGEGSEDSVPEDSLVLGFPKSLIGEQSVFGGVITKISDKTSENLGSLKLTDFPPTHVTSRVATSKDDQGIDHTVLQLIGCFDQCTEESVLQPLLELEIIGADEEKGEIMLDLSSLGSELNLMKMIDRTGKVTKLVAVEDGSKTTTFDYSLTTLVFDIQSKFVPMGSDAKDPKTPVTNVTARWYLKLSSGFNPAFIPRSPVKEVGFFPTDRAKDVKIERHSLSDKVHYFVKNVPAEYQNNVKVSFDNWNAEFKKVTGRELLTYEFLDASLNEKYITGDIRYNILEWDLDNMATYGGLGPSMANQFTGEIMSSNILLQGPRIVDMYSKWFKISEDARALIAEGRPAEADAMMKKFIGSVQDAEKKSKEVSYSVSLGDHKMNVHSQRADLEDPIVKGLFEIVPEGYTFETYMPGYFQEMIQHEMGHNMGLRHNFRGNLGSNESKTKGSVSRSIMEYLGRGYRYVNAIGVYDTMAIAYGYKGILPTHADWFCTDEDQGLDAKTILVKSPECSKADATPDPFSFWEGRLNRAIDIMVAPKNDRAPVLTIDHISDEVGDLAAAFAGYALSAEKTASTWTNFFGKADRPESVTDIKAYVINSMTKRLCDPAIADAIAAKETPEAVKATQDSYNALVKTVNEKLTTLGLIKDKESICK